MVNKTRGRGECRRYAKQDEMIDYTAKVHDSISKHGFHVTCVGAGNLPSFCYSTGIYKSYAIPEIFISSLSPTLSHELIRQYINRFSAHDPILNTRIGAVDERFDYYLIPVELIRLREYVLASFRFYGKNLFEYLQMVYPDTNGHFPGEQGYNYDQELLGTFPPRN